MFDICYSAETLVKLEGIKLGLQKLLTDIVNAFGDLLTVDFVNNVVHFFQVPGIGYDFIAANDILTASWS